MIITKKMPDFGFSTPLNQAHEKFGQHLGIQAFVEAGDDVRFWTEEFLKVELQVNVQAISSIENANGKAAILTALKEKRIIVGAKTLVCMDSDYDYLLDKNATIYTSDFCFQTYTYAIENYYYNPVGLTRYCCQAAAVYEGVNTRLLEILFTQWSTHIYGCFLQRLVDDKDSDNLNATITASIEALSLMPQQDNEVITHTLTAEQLQHFAEKGLSAENVYLYFRGHDLESKIKQLAKELVHQLSETHKTKIQAASSQNNKKGNTAQLITEHFNNRLEIETLAKTRSFPTNHCYELLQHDIQYFLKQYT